MPDRDKVIRWLEACSTGCEYGCPYEYEGTVVRYECKADLMRDALELLKGQTTSGWVSVKERLPEPEENVIIWAKTGCMKYAQYHEDGSINPWYVYEDNARAWTNVISHWMPLPEPPKEENHETD